MTEDLDEQSKRMMFIERKLRGSASTLLWQDINRLFAGLDGPDFFEDKEVVIELCPTETGMGYVHVRICGIIDAMKGYLAFKHIDKYVEKVTNDLLGQVNQQTPGGPPVADESNG